MDIYWVVRAGQDPVAIFEKHPGRFTFVHVKDRDKPTVTWTPRSVTAILILKTILGKAKLGGIKHFIVEQENYTNIDPYVSITQSASYLKNTLHV